MDDRYRERRAAFEQGFRDYHQEPDAADVTESPSKRYRLSKTRYTAGPSSLGFSRGVVFDVASGHEIADIRRDISPFWHAWVLHPNGNEYLLCGEDYQGYLVLNLTEGVTHVHFPEDGYAGGGFCWAAVHPSPDGLTLAVHGCYWAAEYDLVFIDFREPDRLPLPVLKRIERVGQVEGWIGPEILRVQRDRDVRRSDRADYESLPDEEQERLDADEDLVETVTDTLDVKRPSPDALREDDVSSPRSS